MIEKPFCSTAIFSLHWKLSMKREAKPSKGSDRRMSWLRNSKFESNLIPDGRWFYLPSKSRNKTKAYVLLNQNLWQEKILLKKEKWSQAETIIPQRKEETRLTSELMFWTNNILSHKRKNELGKGDCQVKLLEWRAYFTGLSDFD